MAATNSVTILVTILGNSDTFRHWLPLSGTYARLEYAGEKYLTYTKHSQYSKLTF